MDEAAIREIARIAAREAMAELMTDLGADAKAPFEMQRDFAFLRSLRQSTETVKRQGLITSTIIVLTAFFGWLTMWWLGKGGP